VGFSDWDLSWITTAHLQAPRVTSYDLPSKEITPVSESVPVSFCSNVHLQELGLYEVHPCRIEVSIMTFFEKYEVVVTVENNYLLRARPDTGLAEGERTREVVAYGNSMDAALRLMELFVDRHTKLYNARHLENSTVSVTRTSGAWV
jgi:hypothetical protein